MDGKFERKEKKVKNHTQIMHTYKTNKHNTFYITLQMAALRHFINNITIKLLYLTSMSITDSKI